jgi:plasmid stabilization system protein ParE
MKVELTRRAEIDFELIVDYLKARDARAARSLAGRLQEAILGLRRMPERFSFTVRYSHLRIRRRTLDNYLILFRVTETSVIVIAILHAAQDYERFLERLTDDHSD